MWIELCLTWLSLCYLSMSMSMSVSMSMLSFYVYVSVVVIDHIEGGRAPIESIE